MCAPVMGDLRHLGLLDIQPYLRLGGSGESPGSWQGQIELSIPSAAHRRPRRQTSGSAGRRPDTTGRPPCLCGRRREGADLWHILRIGVPDAVLGAVATVPAPDGRAQMGAARLEGLG